MLLTGTKDNLIRDLLRCDHPADILAVCYRFFVHNKTRFYTAAALPGRFYTEGCRARVNTLFPEFFNELAPDGYKIGEIPERARRRIASMLESSEGDLLVEAILALIQATESLMPKYREHRKSKEWALGGPLNCHFDDTYAVYPLPFDGESPVKRYIKKTEEGGVSSITRRAIHPSSLFEKHRVVDHTGDFVSDVSPEHFDNRWLQISRVGSIEELTIVGCCLRDCFEEAQIVYGNSDADGSSFYVREPAPKKAEIVDQVLVEVCDGTTHLVIFPELTMSEVSEQRVAERLRSLEEHEKPCLVVTGTRHVDAGQGWMRNIATVLDGDGNTLWRQLKINPSALLRPSSDKTRSIFYSEKIKPGNRVIARDTPFGRICVMICSDAVLPELCEFVASLAPDIILIPTLNPGSQESLHRSLAERIPYESLCLIASVNSCAVGTYDRKRISFVYLSVATRDRCTYWHPCQDTPPSCTLRVKLGQLPIAVRP